MIRITKVHIIFSLLLLIVATSLVYKPGLKGGFIFDDYSTVPNLKVIQGEVTIESVKKYLGESTSGPLKRPVSVLSFLLDASTWPADPYNFKRTNLLIHLLNGCLIFTLLYWIFKYKGFTINSNLLISITSTGMWLLHPLLVSTTLYVVQRMAMLPLTFMLLGFLLYYLSRVKYSITEGHRGLFSMIVATYLFGLLATLSKENGVVYIWLLTLFEFFILRRYLGLKALSKTTSILLLVLPSVILVLIFILKIPDFISGYDVRTYSWDERLLTQMRVITDYIKHLLLPEYFTVGVFTDGYQYSKSIFNPISTLLSTLFILALLVLAWVKRHQWVWFSFSIFFFFVAQILESTIVPLELYFEHRVYIASIFMSVPFILIIEKYSREFKLLKLLPFVLLLLLGGLTFMRANIWSNNLQLHQLTMQKFPESVRARISTAVIYEQSGLTGDALQILEKGSEMHENLELEFNRYAVYCKLGSIKLKQIEELTKSLQEVNFVRNDRSPFVRMIRLMNQTECLGQDTVKAIESIAIAAEKNPNKKYKELKALTNYMLATVAIKRNQYDMAETYFLTSFDISKTEYISMQNAIFEFIKVGEYDRAQRILDYERKVYEKDFKFKYDWLNVGETIEAIQIVINAEKNDKKSDDNHSS